MNITIGDYQDTDAKQVGILIADTYPQFNLAYLPPEEMKAFLGPFQYARSAEKSHQEVIANMICSEWVFVAEDDGEIVGVLRGRKERLGSLFVRGDHHRKGIGRKLVERFKQECQKHAPMGIRVLLIQDINLKIFSSNAGACVHPWNRSNGLAFQRSNPGRNSHSFLDSG